LLLKASAFPPRIFTGAAKRSLIKGATPGGADEDPVKDAFSLKLILK
jgi:hypothetical protein